MNLDHEELKLELYEFRKKVLRLVEMLELLREFPDIKLADNPRLVEQIDALIIYGLREGP